MVAGDTFGTVGCRLFVLVLTQQSTHPCITLLSSTQAHSGGSVVISSGSGKTDGQPKSGGSGGHMILNAGIGEGVGFYGDGGSIELKAGKSLHSNGGHLVLQSGSSDHATSGSIGKNPRYKSLTPLNMPRATIFIYHHFFFSYQYIQFGRRRRIWLCATNHRQLRGI